jgi:hypothetical protein
LAGPDPGHGGDQVVGGGGGPAEPGRESQRGPQNKGLITREPSPLHAKVVIVSLTEPGRQLLNRAYQEVIALERALTDAFAPADRVALCDLLGQATSVLIEQTPTAPAKSTG